MSQSKLNLRGDMFLCEALGCVLLLKSIKTACEVLWIVWQLKLEPSMPLL